MKTSSNNVRPPSPGLIIQCHGGGFVAQSSASHEVCFYLVFETRIFCIYYSSICKIISVRYLTALLNKRMTMLLLPGRKLSSDINGSGSKCFCRRLF
jgi:hypothetical protein